MIAVLCADLEFNCRRLLVYVEFHDDYVRFSVARFIHRVMSSMNHVLSYVWQICFACFILEIFIKCSVHTHVTDDTSKPYLRIAGALVCSREPI